MAAEIQCCWSRLKPRQTITLNRLVDSNDGVTMTSKTGFNMKKFTALLIIFLHTSQAEIPNEVKFEIDQRVKHELNASIAFGMLTEGETDVYVAGWQNRESKTPATTATVYEMGSISKTFTALLLAQQVTNEQVSLNDPVQRWWPQPFALQDDSGQPVTFKHLATHTSGLPRLPKNLAVFNQDPYAEYDRQQLLAGVKMTTIKAVGKDLAYSNFGFGLLGETLAAQAGQSFEHLVAEKLLQPLALQHTYQSLDAVPEALLATGYRGNKPATAWQFKALAGAGWLRTDIRDLLTYGSYILNPEAAKVNPQLTQALRLVTQAQHQGEVQVGLGWFIRNDIIWHNGATAGFNAILMISPETQTVVAGITNGTESIEDIALHLLKPERPMTDHGFPVAIETAALTAYTGTYARPENNQSMAIKLLDNRLFFAAEKQPKQAMTYIGNDTFKLGFIKARIQFQRDPAGQVNGLELTGWGEPQSYQLINQSP